MPTSTITNTISDASGGPIVGVPVTVRLYPEGCFRVDTGAELADVATVTNSQGIWSLNLEQQANIAPLTSVYLVEEDVPDSLGGPRQWRISVGPSNQTLQQAQV